MVAFKEKDLDDLTIGDAFREARLERGESIEDVERLTHVGKKYIAALEANDLGKLPEAVYAKNFVMALATHFGIDKEAAAANLLREMAVAGGPPTSDRPVNFVEGRRLMVTPTLLKSGVIVVIFIAIIGYFGFSVNNILKPPSLTIYSPHDQESFPTSRVVLEGLTEPEVDLRVNDEPVAIDRDGSFKDVLNLPPGVSNLRLTAKKKHSRENQVFLRVVVAEAPALLIDATSTEEIAPPSATATVPVVSPAPKPKPKPPTPSATSTEPIPAPPADAQANPLP